MEVQETLNRKREILVMKNIQAEDYTRLEEEETLTRCGTVFCGLWIGVGHTTPKHGNVICAQNKSFISCLILMVQI